MTLQDVQEFARLRGCIVERVGRGYEWYRSHDHSEVGVCDTLAEVRDEISFLCPPRDQKEAREITLYAVVKLVVKVTDNTSDNAIADRIASGCEYSVKHRDDVCQISDAKLLCCTDEIKIVL